MKMKSVHLENFPDFKLIPNDTELLHQIETVRSICNAALFLRSEENIKVKIPLNKITIYCKDKLQISDFEVVIKDEINVQNVEYSEEVSKIGNSKVVLNLKLCGAKLGSETGRIMKLVNAGEYSITNEKLNVGGIQLEKEYFQVKFDLIQDKKSSIRYTQISFGIFSKLKSQIFVSLDTEITSEMRQMGHIREIVRSIQKGRKRQNLNLGDIVSITIETDSLQVESILKDETGLKHITDNTLCQIKEVTLINSFTDKDVADSCYLTDLIEDLGYIRIFFIASNCNKI